MERDWKVWTPCISKMPSFFNKGSFSRQNSCDLVFLVNKAGMLYLFIQIPSFDLKISELPWQSLLHLCESQQKMSFIQSICLHIARRLLSQHITYNATLRLFPVIISRIQGHYILTTSLQSNALTHEIARRNVFNRKIMHQHKQVKYHWRRFKPKVSISITVECWKRSFASWIYWYSFHKQCLT